MVKLKRRLVLQLVAEQGRFWKLVNEARQLRGIVPETRVPPANFFSQGLMPHQPDVYRIRDEVVPDTYYRLFAFGFLGFIAACLEYQPPRLEISASTPGCNGNRWRSEAKWYGGLKARGRQSPTRAPVPIRLA